ncbi:minor tail protein [Gordonia phage Bakery]|uniref:Minor tail protein n=1 Tax=Gordonia phage Bakery TaxID=2591205 RepID=A0A514DGS6_9CAUD|nr:minor tail protein [Gordonia phage Bakery]QDH92821.1 minor tail protein [Gordonia phage Bakery]
MATITFTVDGPESRGGGLATFTPRVDMTVDGVLVTPGKSWRDVPYTFNVQAETDLPEGQWWIRGIDKHRYPIDVTGPADVKDLIVHGLPDNAPATTLSQAAAAWLEANVDTEVTGPLVEGILADPESAARGVLDGAYVRVVETDGSPVTDQVARIVRDANGDIDDIILEDI